MSRAVVAGTWKRKRDTLGQWGYYCGGEGCGHRLAEYREGDRWITLEPGYSNRGEADAPYRRSFSNRDQYGDRGPMRRVLASIRAGRHGIPSPVLQGPPDRMNPHPKMRMPVPFDEPGPGRTGPDFMPAYVHCFGKECDALNEIGYPPTA